MLICRPIGEVFAIGRVDHQSKVFTFDHFIDDNDDDPYVPLTPSSEGSNSIPLNGFVNLPLDSSITYYIKG